MKPRSRGPRGFAFRPLAEAMRGVDDRQPEPVDHPDPMEPAADQPAKPGPRTEGKP